MYLVVRRLLRTLSDYQFLCQSRRRSSGMAYKLINYIRYAAYFVFGLLH